MNLKLSEYANIAEVVGAIAIVISLVYVGLQVNDSARATRSASANEAAALSSNWYLQVGGSSENSDIFFNGLRNPDSLSDHDRLRFMYMNQAIMILLQNSWYLASEGSLDLELRDTVTNTVLGVRELPGFLLYWSQRKSLFKPGFQTFVDDLIVSGQTNTSLEQTYEQRKGR